MRKSCLFLLLILTTTLAAQTTKVACLLSMLLCMGSCNQPYKQQTQMRVTYTQLPDLPGINNSLPLGVSAPFAGISEHVLLVAGGCNFPDKPVTEGGAKRYYDEIHALPTDSPTAWKQVGHLPLPLAYGASTHTPEGLVWIGGNNNDTSSCSVFRINWNPKEETVEICMLPDLPVPMDNLSATYAGNRLYVAGGNESGTAANRFLMLELAQARDGKWQQLPDFPGAARVQPVLAAQENKEGNTRIYLSGGFQPATDDQAGIVSADMLVYCPETNEWKTENLLPPLADGSPRSLVGGCAVASDNRSILLFGGVNYTRFLSALNRPLQIKQAIAAGDTALQTTLRQEATAYMHHPVSWYQFNTELLCYNTDTKKWENLGHFEQAARAGAGAAIAGDRLFIINGELKPGIRTPQVSLLQLTTVK